MSSAEVYYNTSAEYAEVSYDIPSSGGAGDGTNIQPLDVDRKKHDGNVTYYNTDAEYAEYSNDVPNEGANSDGQDIVSHDTDKRSNGSNSEDDVSDELSTVTSPEIIRQKTSKTTRKVPSLYDENMYSLAGLGDRESANGSQKTLEAQSSFKTKDKSEKKRMNACFRCGLPIALVLLSMVGVGVVLHQNKMFAGILKASTQG